MLNCDAIPMPPQRCAVRRNIAAIALEIVASCENSREMRLENAAVPKVEDQLAESKNLLAEFRGPILRNNRSQAGHHTAYFLVRSCS